MGGVLITIIGGLFLYLIINSFFEKPDIEINIDRISDTNIQCHNVYETEIEFTVANKGEPTGFISYSYYRVNQTNNTCKEDLYFLDSSKAMCYLQYIDEGNEQFCKSKTPTLGKGKHKIIKYSLSTEAYDFYDIIKNENKTCIIVEELSICAKFDNEISCSQPKAVKIKYNPCKNR